MRNREILGTSSTPPRLRTRSKASLILGTPYFLQERTHVQYATAPYRPLHNYLSISLKAILNIMLTQSVLPINFFERKFFVAMTLNCDKEFHYPQCLSKAIALQPWLESRQNILINLKLLNQTVFRRTLSPLPYTSFLFIKFDNNWVC